jgi:hypothetical protein
MTFARWVFRLAGLYGLLVLLPQFFLEEQIGRDQPPPITHPEHFYGFVGVAVAWQVAFLIIGQDPARYRPLMLAAVLEKLTFGIAVIALFALGRVADVVLGFALIDLALGGLFLAAWWRSAPAAGQGGAGPLQSTHHPQP